MAGDRIVELARAAIRRLGRAAPTEELARGVQEAIDKVGSGPPYTVAVVGELPARSALLDVLAGHALFAARSEPPRVVLTVQRGPSTRWRARRRDGSVDEMVRGPDGLVEERDALADQPADRPQRNAVPRHLTAEPTTPAPSRIEQGVADSRMAAADERPDDMNDSEMPRRVTAEQTALVRRPPWWALWAWLLFWWRTWRANRSTLRGDTTDATAGHAPTRRAAESRRATATTSDDLDADSARSERHVSDDRVDRIARSSVSRRTAHVIARPAPPPRPFAETLCELFSDDTVERIFLDVSDGPLPDDVIVIDVAVAADARVLVTTGIDACVVAVDRDGVRAVTPQIEGVLTIVPHVFVVDTHESTSLGREAGAKTGDDRVRTLGHGGRLAAQLRQVAQLERQIGAGQRVLIALGQGADQLQRALDDAEAGFRDRIGRLEARRIPDIDGYVAAELARLRSATVEHAHRSLRRATANVDADIVALAEAWTAELRGVTSTDGLRTIAGTLDSSSVVALQAATARRLRKLLDDLTEYTLAQYLELVSALREGTDRTDPLPAVLGIEVAIGEIREGTHLGTVAPRLTSLFRSLEALKTATLEQLERRVGEIRQHVSALFLDGEPRLEPAVTAALGIAWHADAERHGVWLDAALGAEQSAIATERSQLAPIAMALEAARYDSDELRVAVDALVMQLPESRRVPG